jgi:ribosomal protein L32
LEFKIDLGRSGASAVPLGNVKSFFSVCPLCYAKDSTNVETENRWGGLVQKSHVVCKECGARWLLLADLFDYVKGAQLVLAGVDEKGADLLQVEHPLGFWQRLALLGLKEKQEKVIKEREVIVKEIVKIRCSYCHKLYDESLSKCPNCGASR